ncbi:MAG: hypothetical protein L0229_13080 [Blastocatellia bacterium]|nr:hypothetical protein [Blastocatellia bacterium]
MDTDIPIEEIDTREGHLKLIFIHWNLFAFRAWDGYRRVGRGAVMLNLNDVTGEQLMGSDVQHQMAYLGERSDTFKNWPSDEASEQVQVYDPESEILVFVYSRDYKPGGEPHVYRLEHGTSLAPPDVFDKYNS